MSQRPSPASATNQECEPCLINPGARVEGQSYKALLIGIRGTATANAEYPELTGPHQDVEDMRDLLIDYYGYRASDITVLIDDGVAGHLQPTRANILKAVGDLVKGAKAGDHIYFHYCGHSMQIPNRSNREEKEGCLIPSDGVKQRIVDHELIAVLVRPLPAGCQLVAVLDTCHSRSLLNLGHFRCNRVMVVPTCQSEGIRCRVVRCNSRMVSRTASLLPGRKVDTSSPSPSMGPSTGNVNSICRSSTPRTASSSLDRHASAEARGSGPGSRRIFTCRTSTITPGPANDGDAVLSNESDDVLSPLPSKSWFLSEEYQRCDSPGAMYDCTGRCWEADQPAAEAEHTLGGVVADVISLASCKDSELTYEDENGHSMTSSFVEILRRNPYQSLKEVFLSISHAMHAKAEKRHENAKKYKEEFRAWKAKLTAKLAPDEKKNAEDHRTMSLVSSEAPPSPLRPSETYPRPTTSFFARRVDQLKDQLKLKRDVFESYSTLHKNKSVEVDLHHFQHPELSSPRPLNLESPFRP
ncbi:Metacaspase type II [Mycena sanguinolenta]|uniref:Metacaspase type II n=1 Tax=Mycena sanguinolenta TaxID=230812 RepID=A0A8H6XZU4_9AGAR|nr:Metacaspase type II [Mycena sanguinolenta]